MGPLIAFLWAAAEINNKDTLKLCKKITKITDPNSVFFLGDGTNLRCNSRQNLKIYRFKSIFSDENGLLLIIIDKKNYWFLPERMKSRSGPLCQLRLPFLRREGTTFSGCLSIRYQTILSFYIMYRVRCCHILIAV